MGEITRFIVRDASTFEPKKTIELKDAFVVNNYFEKQSDLEPNREVFLIPNNLSMIIKHFQEYRNDPTMYPLWTNFFLADADTGHLTQKGSMEIEKLEQKLLEIYTLVDWNHEMLTLEYFRY